MGRLEGVATLLDQRGQLSLPPNTAGGGGVGLRASQQGVLWPRNDCPVCLWILESTLPRALLRKEG